MRVQMLFQRPHARFSIVKNRGGERGVSATFAEDLDKMLGAARASGSDYGDADGLSDQFGQLAIESGASAIAIH